MENWIGAYRLPPNLGLGVERDTETVDGVGGGGGGGGGVSPIPGTTPSPGLINMWSNAIKVEQNNHQHSISASGSIKGKGRNSAITLSISRLYIVAIVSPPLS